MKKSMLPVFLCEVLIFTTVLGQLPPVGVDAVSNDMGLHIFRKILEK